MARRWLVRGGLAAAGTGLALAGLLLVEVRMAASAGPQPALLAPAGLDVCVRCDDGGRPLRLVVVGDSLSAAVGVERPEDGYVAVAAGRLGRPVEVRNLAVSGHTVGDALSLQVPQLQEGQPPDIVIVELGANDVTHLTGRATFRSQLRRVLAAVPAGVPVLVLGVPDMGSPPRLAQPLRAIAGLRGRVLDDIVRDEAGRREGARYVPIAARTGPAFRRDDRLFSVDRFHPSTAGYLVWADAVGPELAAAASR